MHISLTRLASHHIRPTAATHWRDHIIQLLEARTRVPDRCYHSGKVYKKIQLKSGTTTPSHKDDDRRKECYR